MEGLHKKEPLYVVSDKFSIKLKQHFNENIKFSFVSSLEVIIVTKDDYVYEFDRFGTNTSSNSFIAFCDNSSLIKPILKDYIVEELCQKGVIDFKTTSPHVIALTKDGKVYFWEHNKLINKNDMNRRHDPKLIKCLSDENITIIAISCGYMHTVLLTANGDVYTWGWSKTGEIGDKCYDRFNKHLLITTSANHLREIPLYHVKGFNDEKVIAISCGSEHSLALTETGFVYSWGNNNWDQLGTPKMDNIEQNTPKLISMNGVFIKKIICGSKHSLLLSSDGDIYTFGCNQNRQLGYDKSANLINKVMGYFGLSKNEELLAPRILSHSKKFVDIASDGIHDISIALSDDGIYYVWGKCGRYEQSLDLEQVIKEPKETEFKSFNEIFEYYYQITYEPEKNSIIKFEDNLFRNNCYKRFFTELNKLGKGSYGKVFEVKISMENLAIKIIKIGENLGKNPHLMYELRNFPIITNLSHENVLKFDDGWLEFNSCWKEKSEMYLMYILMETCDGKIKDLIKDFKVLGLESCEGDFTLLGYYIVSEIFTQILKGVEYLHKQNILHRDLNPNNILFKFKENSLNFIKIADFGLATIHKYGVPLNSNEEVLHTRDKADFTLDYMAPEVEEIYVDWDKTKAKYNTKCDIYSLGVILQEDLFCIDTEWDYLNDENQNSVLNSKYERAKNLSIEMMSDEPNERPDCEEILRNIDSFTLKAEEFSAREEFDKVLISNQNNKKDLCKLLEHLKKILFKTEIQ